MPKVKPPKKIGRPTKFSQQIQDRIQLFARKGFTDVEISQGIGITEATLTNWKKKHPGFFASLNDWKHQANEMVSRSLYERACGYSHPETKAQWVQDEGGGRWEYAELIRHYPPDPTSMIFWLKNREPDKWRDRQEMAVDVTPRLMDVAIQAAKKVMGK